MILGWEWALLALPALACCLTLFNLIFWPRGRQLGDVDDVSILIPARNEEASIEAAVRSALREPVREVVVYDDGSTDRTPEILASLQAEDGRLRVRQGEPLPEGWVGKPHACHQLAKSAEGSLLFFMDADVELEPQGARRMFGCLDRFDAQVVTAVPRQETATVAEKLILPLLHLTYLSWLPIPLVWRSRDPRFLAANGQLLAVRRTAYDAVGGFAAVRDAVVDDMAICREFKEAGHRVVFADGHRVARCRMYESAGEIWEGFSKNIFEGIGSAAGLIVALALYLAAFVVPWVLIPFGLTVAPSLLWPAVAGVALNLLQRLAMLARFRQSIVGVLLHPLAILGLCAIAVNSWVWNLKDDIVWSGRSYASKGARRG